MPHSPGPYTSDELEALWDRWYNNPDPDVARLTSREIGRLFETIWEAEGMEPRRKPAPPPSLASQESTE
jgi:hypothetical protein